MQRGFVLRKFVGGSGRLGQVFDLDAAHDGGRCGIRRQIEHQRAQHAAQVVAVRKGFFDHPQTVGERFQTDLNDQHADAVAAQRLQHVPANAGVLRQVNDVAGGGGDGGHVRQLRQVQDAGLAHPVEQLVEGGHVNRGADIDHGLHRQVQQGVVQRVGVAPVAHLGAGGGQQRQIGQPDTGQGAQAVGAKIVDQLHCRHRVQAGQQLAQVGQRIERGQAVGAQRIDIGLEADGAQRRCQRGHGGGLQRGQVGRADGGGQISQQLRRQCGAQRAQQRCAQRLHHRPRRHKAQAGHQRGQMAVGQQPRHARRAQVLQQADQLHIVAGQLAQRQHLAQLGRHA